MMSDSVTIISGGMDSVTLLHYLVKRLNKNPSVLTYVYGQKHYKEVEYAKYQAAILGLTDYRIIDLSFLKPVFEGSALVSSTIEIPDIDTVKGDPQPPTYVPNRNMTFLAIASAYAETLGVNDIYYGAQAHDLYGYWDTTPDFLESINKLLSLNRKHSIRVKAPFVRKSKANVLRLGLELGVDYGKTWSCYRGNEYACGNCPTCAERLAAFKEVGITDPLPYK
jgi:7-cyano-7-deazaguanine synthase